MSMLKKGLLLLASVSSTWACDLTEPPYATFDFATDYWTQGNQKAPQSTLEKFNHEYLKGRGKFERLPIPTEWPKQGIEMLYMEKLSLENTNAEEGFELARRAFIPAKQRCTFKLPKTSATVEITPTEGLADWATLKAVYKKGMLVQVEFNLDDMFIVTIRQRENAAVIEYHRYAP